GARALLVARDGGEAKVPVVRVASTPRALGLLAAEHRRRWSGRLVAVAGSAGKTTTRSTIAAALDARAPGAVHFVHGNLNNRIGVPLVLLGLGAQHAYAVVEVGTNTTGEVAELSALAAPDAGVLTLVGLEHTAGLGSLDAIEREEGSLFAHVASGGLAVGNADDERVLRQLERAPASLLRRTYGFAASADYRVLARALVDQGRSRIQLGRPAQPPLQLDCPLLGKAGASALAGAVLVAELLTGSSLDRDALEAAFTRVGVGEPGRLSIVSLANGALIIDDSYNSNPASLASSVAAAAELARDRGSRLLLALGEMRELGDDSPRLHRDASAALLDVPAAWVVAIGGDARWFLEPFERPGVETRFVPDAGAAARLLQQLLQPSDVLLVKASRGVRAERIVEACLQHFGRAD
ncbi:MAG TPA: Mur ligase family protein, partial [Polyangiaceae bacterium]|nr:Mur ligase family protein [Polyangiaceae bacterium]